MFQIKVPFFGGVFLPAIIIASNSTILVKISQSTVTGPTGITSMDCTKILISRRSLFWDNYQSKLGCGIYKKIYKKRNASSLYMCRKVAVLVQCRTYPARIDRAYRRLCGKLRVYVPRVLY